MTTPTATDAANDFWLAFKAEKKEIERALQDATAVDKTQLPEHLNLVLQQINQLDKQITKATSFIPSYDERQYAMQIKDLMHQLDRTRAQLTPKAKFSFRSRQAKAKPTPAHAHASANDACFCATWPPATTSLTATTTSNGNSAPLTSQQQQGDTIEWTNQKDKILSLPNDDLNDTHRTVAVSLSHLDHCVVWLKSASIQVSALHLKKVRRCVIVTDTILGSVLIYGLEQSTIILDCHQFRMHDAHDVALWLHVGSHPIMEDSKEVAVGANPFVNSPGNCVLKMEDFNWLKQQASPNWFRADPERQQAVVRDMTVQPSDLTVLDRLLPEKKE
ncbi:tubulin binding cofactor C-domain-containing protein [Gongronella butleri]|nr:tubulin binding cofactor C-domain-containing protein [Gongronella butleri]